jgi:RNA polymerase-interacting CarD/CdnL/TRCF family regulator
VDVSFQVGDKAVYPAHGVAEVTGIETKEIGGKTLSF